MSLLHKEQEISFQPYSFFVLLFPFMYAFLDLSFSLFGFSISTNYSPPQNLCLLLWHQNCMGFKVDKLQCVSFLVARLRGHVVAFSIHIPGSKLLFLTVHLSLQKFILSFSTIQLSDSDVLQFWCCSRNEFAAILERNTMYLIL